MLPELIDQPRQWEDIGSSTEQTQNYRPNNQRQLTPVVEWEYRQSQVRKNACFGNEG